MHCRLINQYIKHLKVRKWPHTLEMWQERQVVWQINSPDNKKHNC